MASQPNKIAVIPVNCRLWTEEKPSQSDLSLLNDVEVYLDEDRLKRKLLKCSGCGQYYYYEFYETIDWEEGNDPQYRTYIPINNDPVAIEVLNKLDYMEIHQVAPRLLYDWLRDGTRQIKWIR